MKHKCVDSFLLRPVKESDPIFKKAEEAIDYIKIRYLQNGKIGDFAFYQKSDKEIKKFIKLLKKIKCKKLKLPTFKEMKEYKEIELERGKQ